MGEAMTRSRRLTLLLASLAGFCPVPSTAVSALTVGRLDQGDTRIAMTDALYDGLIELDDGRDVSITNKAIVEFGSRVEFASPPNTEREALFRVEADEEFDQAVRSAAVDADFTYRVLAQAMERYDVPFTRNNAVDMCRLATINTPHCMDLAGRRGRAAAFVAAARIAACSFHVFREGE